MNKHTEMIIAPCMIIAALISCYITGFKPVYPVMNDPEQCMAFKAQYLHILSTLCINITVLKIIVPDFYLYFCYSALCYRFDWFVLSALWHNCNLKQPLYQMIKEYFYKFRFASAFRDFPVIVVSSEFYLGLDPSESVQHVGSELLSFFN